MKNNISTSIPNAPNSPTAPAFDWADFVEDMAINNGVTAVVVCVSKEPSHTRLRDKLLHLADTIYAAYGVMPSPHD